MGIGVGWGWTSAFDAVPGEARHAAHVARLGAFRLREYPWDGIVQGGQGRPDPHVDHVREERLRGNSIESREAIGEGTETLRVEGGGLATPGHVGVGGRARARARVCVCE